MAPVATYSRQLHEKRKPALLGKHRYSSVAIRYKVARYVEEIVVKIYEAFQGVLATGDIAQNEATIFF